MTRIQDPHIVPESLAGPRASSSGAEFIWDRDQKVPMRDGVELCVDIYRPAGAVKTPALLAIAGHNKDLQNPDIGDSVPPQPAWSTMWQGGAEAGDSRFLVSRGYTHVVGNPRGFGKSGDGGDPHWDLYDLIEWVAKQPWCDGNVGMIGLSAYALSQWQAAMLQPPSLKAIFPYDAMPCYGKIHDRYPGGLIHVMLYLLDGQNVHHGGHQKPGELSPEMDALWRAAMENPDYRMYSWAYNILTQKGQIHSRLFEHLLNNFEPEGSYEASERDLKKIKIPAYTGAGWHAYTYKMHLLGAVNWYEGIEVPKKLMFSGLRHLERPFHSLHEEIVRWYDYWLKGVENGIMDEPAVKYWVNGANEWRIGADWPLPETDWTKLYLHSWERLREEPFADDARDGYGEPDAFVQMPPTQTRKIEKLRFMTPPLANDTMIAGPISLTFYASIDQEDTNWIVTLKDVGPDPSFHSGREGEMEAAEGLPEIELTRGWLKASYRELDEGRSKPWKPWHKLTRAAHKPVVPGEIHEYQVEVLPTANLFKRGHRICVEISALDLPTGTGFGNNVEYVPYHICSSKTVVHKIYHNARYPSHLLLPVIPDTK
ncbi:MAG: CocE/NonD family hydrolase [Parvularculaceae bacterium]